VQFIISGESGAGKTTDAEMLGERYEKALGPERVAQVEDVIGRILAETTDDPHFVQKGIVVKVGQLFREAEMRRTSRRTIGAIARDPQEDRIIDSGIKKILESGIPCVIEGRTTGWINSRIPKDSGRKAISFLYRNEDPNTSYARILKRENDDMEQENAIIGSVIRPKVTEANGGLNTIWANSTREQRIFLANMVKQTIRDTLKHKGSNRYMSYEIPDLPEGYDKETIETYKFLFSVVDAIREVRAITSNLDLGRGFKAMEYLDYPPLHPLYTPEEIEVLTVARHLQNLDIWWEAHPEMAGIDPFDPKNDFYYKEINPSGPAGNGAKEITMEAIKLGWFRKPEEDKSEEREPEGRGKITRIAGTDEHAVIEFPIRNAG